MFDQESKPILYNYFRSSSSHRVRIALHLKKIEFEYRSVHLVKNGGEQHSSAYLKLNPKAEVPVLVDGSNKLSQSMAIIQYLDARWPSPALFPNDIYAKNFCIQICEMINSGIQPLQNLKVVQEMIRRYKLDPKERDVWSAYWIIEGFSALEKVLSESAEKYCMGNMITAADCFLVPQVVSAHRFGVKVKDYPNISRINENCMKQDAFIKASPDRQIDFQN